MRTLRNLEARRLYAILDTVYLAGRDPALIASQMIEGGVDIIQVRAKDRSPREIVILAKAVLEVAHAASVPVIINDHPAVAVEIGADGVHVGQTDIPVPKARQILGGEVCWIGKSTHTLEQALTAEAEGVDYIGVGPVFATPTKPEYPPVGLDLVRAVNSRLKIPFFSIGGIKRENAKDVLFAGAKRLVVVSGILRASDVVAYCRDLQSILDQK